MKVKELQSDGSFKRTKRKQIEIKPKKKKCSYCHDTENLTIDHKIAVVDGGTDGFKNLQVLCERCNGMKSSIPDGTIRKIFKWHTQIVMEKDYRKRKRQELMDWVCGDNSPNP